MIWNGIDVSLWGPVQTRRPRAALTYAYTWYTGYDVLGDVSDLVPRIPLDVRYQDFCDRLKAKRNIVTSG